MLPSRSVCFFKFLLFDLHASEMPQGGLHECPTVRAGFHAPRAQMSLCLILGVQGWPIMPFLGITCRACDAGPHAFT